MDARAGRQHALAVATPHRFGPWWLFGGEVRATLTLPRELEGTALDASLDLSAGDLTVDGEFGDLGIEVGAGSLTVDGAAETLTVDLSAGGADIDLADVYGGAVQCQRRRGGFPADRIDAAAGDGRRQRGLARAETAGWRIRRALGRLGRGLRERPRTRREFGNVVDVTVSAGTVTIVSAR